MLSWKHLSCYLLSKQGCLIVKSSSCTKADLWGQGESAGTLGGGLVSMSSLLLGPSSKPGQSQVPVETGLSAKVGISQGLSEVAKGLACSQLFCSAAVCSLTKFKIPQEGYKRYGI